MGKRGSGELVYVASACVPFLCQVEREKERKRERERERKKKVFHNVTILHSI